MARTIQLTLQAPLAGMIRSTSYQTDPPFSSFDSLNYWVVDAKTGRMVVATRPGLETLTSPTGEVSLLSNVSGVNSGGGPFRSFIAGIGTALYYWDGTQLVAATGAQANSMDTGRNVSVTALVNNAFITKDGEKPIVFNYADGTAVTLVESAGTLPVDMRIAATWNGHLCLAGRLDKPHVLYMSRGGVPLDWDFSVGPADEFGAFFSDTDFEGVLSGPITAIMPQNSQTLLIGTTSGTLAMRGHPRQGGGFHPIGDSYPLGHGAWVKLPGDIILMLTLNGIMALSPEPGAVMVPVSREKIPEQLKELLYSYADPNVTMIHDTRWDGIHIFVRGLQEQAWRYDIITGGFVRDEIGSYPSAAIEFDDFKTENTSGVLLGRYDGLKFFDRHSTEVITCSLTTSPVKLSQSQGMKSKIQKLRVVFGRDTPTVANSGDLFLATGTDGQDAINRMLSGNHQYSISLTELKNNNGVCHPKLAGHAAVVSISSDNGDVAIEEISLTVVEAGMNRLPRSTQIASTGATTSFTDSFVDLDTTLWAGYQEATPIAPTSQLPDYTHFLNLGLLSTEWWTHPNIDGGDIRVADSNDVQAPSMVIDFDLATETGMLAFRMTQPVAPKSVRVWVGNIDTTTPSPSSEFGSENVFDDNWIGFWPDGAGDSNATKYDDNTFTDDQGGGSTGVLSAVFGDETGPIGSNATDMAQGNDTWWQIADWPDDQGLASNTTWTFVGVIKRTAEVNGTEDIVSIRGNGFLDYQRMNATETSNQPITGINSFVNGASIESGLATGSTEPTGNWVHHAGVVASSTSRTAYIEGVAGTEDTGSSAPVLDEDFFVGGVVFMLQAHLSMLQVHDVVRSTDWIKYQNDMLDQGVFWGSIGAFQLINTIAEVELDLTACPSGFDTTAEAGTWAGYAEQIPTDPVGGSVSQFSHLIDLSTMPTDWWNNVAVKAEIRATDSNNVFLPLDIISFVDNEDGTGTGLIVVRKTQAVGTPSAIRLWVGNGSAITVDKCSRYGQYSAYDANWRGFWPSGTGNDRTQFINNMTSVGSPSVVEAESPVGGQATLFDNSVSTTMYATATANVPATVPYTLTASAKRPTLDLHEDLVLAAVQSSVTQAAAILHTRPSSTPARLTTRNQAGSEQTAGESTTVAIGNYWFQAGIAFGNNSRVVSVGAGGTSQGGQGVAVVESITTISVGADILGTPSRGFKGHITLVGLHTIGRGNDWRDYWNASLTQSSFWGTWAWTADAGNALTQP